MNKFQEFETNFLCIKNTIALRPRGLKISEFMKINKSTIALHPHDFPIEINILLGPGLALVQPGNF